jgi:hypothetical protein
VAIQRPPACKQHAADLPGTAHIVESEECPFCWAEEREKDKEQLTFRLQIHMPESDGARCDRCEFPRRDHTGDELLCPAPPTWERGQDEPLTVGTGLLEKRRGTTES